MKYGIIDIGSNTIRLNMYLVDEKKNMVSLANKKYVAGMVSYVNKGYLTKKGADKLVSILKELILLCDVFGVDEVYPFATASLRNIKNSKEVLEYVNRKANTKIDLVSGKEEANLGYLGIIQEYQLVDGYILDIGGGSTEITLIEDEKIAFSNSLKLGSLSLMESYCKGIFPTKSEAKKMQDKIKRNLKKYDIPKTKKTPEVYGIGGTIRACGKVSKELFDLPGANELDIDVIENLYDKLIVQKPHAIKQVLQVNPARIHTIIPGMIILREILKYLKAKNLFISNKGAREGYLYKILN